MKFDYVNGSNIEKIVFNLFDYFGKIYLGFVYIYMGNE